MMINELIEQIGGRERLLDIKSRIEIYGHGAGYKADEVELMAGALLAVLDAKPVAYTHESEISNMHVTGLYIRGFPIDRRLNAEEGYTIPLYTIETTASAPDGLADAVNRLLDSDGSRGTFSAIRRGDSLAEVERLLAAAPAPGG